MFDVRKKEIHFFLTGEFSKHRKQHLSTCPSSKDFLKKGNYAHQNSFPVATPGILF
jgi:hypothetical protein